MEQVYFERLEMIKFKQEMQMFYLSSLCGFEI